MTTEMIHATHSVRHYLIEQLDGYYKELRPWGRDRAIGQIKVVTYGRKPPMLELSTPQLQELWRVVQGLIAVAENKPRGRTHITLWKLKDALIRSVRLSNRAAVLGLPEPTKGTAKKPPVGTDLRIYMHTLDGRPATFNGTQLDYLPLGEASRECALLTRAELRREQSKAQRAVFKLGVNVDGYLRRMSWMSVRVHNPSKKKESDV